MSYVEKIVFTVDLVKEEIKLILLALCHELSQILFWIITPPTTRGMNYDVHFIDEPNTCLLYTSDAADE